MVYHLNDHLSSAGNYTFLIVNQNGTFFTLLISILTMLTMKKNTMYLCFRWILITQQEFNKEQTESKPWGQLNNKNLLSPKLKVSYLLKTFIFLEKNILKNKLNLYYSKSAFLTYIDMLTLKIVLKRWITKPFTFIVSSSF